MAKLKLFVIHDAKSGFYHPPFAVRAVGEALRHWGELANDEKTSICKYPAEFHLYELGEFDDSAGVVSQLNQLRPYGAALEHKKRPDGQLPLNLSGHGDQRERA